MIRKLVLQLWSVDGGGIESWFWKDGYLGGALGMHLVPVGRQGMN